MRKLHPRAETLGGGHSNLVMLDTDAQGRKSVIKQYGVAGTLLGAIARFALPVPNPGGIRRMERFRSDRAAFSDFAAAQIPASTLLSTDEETGTNVNSFMEGKPLLPLMQADPAVLAESGRSLRQVHERGWAVIDIQPSNFILNAQARAAFIDLEHAYRDPANEYRAWDLADYLSWVEESYGPKDKAAARDAVAAFRRGYGPIHPLLAARVEELRTRLKAFRPFMRISSLDSQRNNFPLAILIYLGELAGLR